MASLQLKGQIMNCEEFQAFAQQYGFKHVTSSPNYPQSNVLGENGVKIVKRIIKKAVLSLQVHSPEEQPVTCRHVV